MDDFVPGDTDPVSRAALGCLQHNKDSSLKDTLILIPLVNDSTRKLAAILKAEGYRVHTVYIPPTQGQTSDDECFRQGEACADGIFRYTGHRITQRELQAAQRKIAEARKQIRHFWTITDDRPELLPSLWWLFILHSYYCADNLEDWTRHLRLLNGQLMSNPIHQKQEIDNGSVLLLGSPVHFPNYKLPFLIHEVNLKVVTSPDGTSEVYRTDQQGWIDGLPSAVLCNEFTVSYSPDIHTTYRMYYAIEDYAYFTAHFFKAYVPLLLGCC